MMTRILYLLTFIISVAILVPSISYAQQVDTCDEKTYCERNTDGSEKGLIRKSGCRIASQFAQSCEDQENQTGQSCKTSGRKVCICDYQTISTGSCINPGGTKDAGSNTFESVFRRVAPPKELTPIGTGSDAISNIIQRVIQLLYTIAGVAFVIFFIWNALQLIISGGDKDKVAGARKHITWSIIGITLLALAFPIMRVIESIIGIKFFF